MKIDNLLATQGAVGCSAWLGLLLHIAWWVVFVAWLASLLAWLRLSVKYNRAYREYQDRYGEVYRHALEANKLNRVSLQYARRFGEPFDRCIQFVGCSPLSLGDSSIPSWTRWARVQHKLAKLLVCRIKDSFLKFHKQLKDERET